jgi:hypothetical protein
LRLSEIFAFWCALQVSDSAFVNVEDLTIRHVIGKCRTSTLAEVRKARAFLPPTELFSTLAELEPELMWSCNLSG